MQDQARDTSPWRKLMTTPIGHWLTGRPSGSLDWQARITGADLPENARQLVERVVRKSRLWKSERVDVADELIAHFEDGLQAGSTAGELLRGFGDPHRAARLIRRAKKRQRPLAWQVIVRSLQAVAAIIALYALLTGWFLIGEPDVSTNYFAKLTAPARAVPENQCAWPLYRTASLEHGLPGMDLDPILYIDMPDGGDRFVRPTDEQWPEAKAFLQRHRDLLALIREGAAKPGLGIVGAPSMRGFSERDRRALYEPDRLENLMNWPHPAPDPDEVWKSQSVSRIEMPHLTIMQQMARLLAADLQLAAIQDNGQRALADAAAMIGLARQTREIPLVINDLVSRSILHKMFLRLAAVLTERPGVLNDEQLIALAHQLAALDDFAEFRSAGEKYFMLDTLQRFYDDEGDITYEGLRFITHDLRIFMSDHTAKMLGSMPLVLSLPLANLLIADRDEMVEQYRRLTAMAEKYAERPLWEQLRTESGVREAAERWRESPILSIRYAVLLAVRPPYDRAAIMANHTIAFRDALLTAIALELYRRDHAAYPPTLTPPPPPHPPPPPIHHSPPPPPPPHPPTLTALAPHYLPQPPIDHSTGKPLLYKLTNGQPILYGRGLDGDDDGGVQGPVPQSSGSGFPRVPDQGDWLLYPLVFE